MWVNPFSPVFQAHAILTHSVALPNGCEYIRTCIRDVCESFVKFLIRSVGAVSGQISRNFYWFLLLDLIHTTCCRGRESNKGKVVNGMFDTETIRLETSAARRTEEESTGLVRTTFSGEKLTRFINLKTLCGCLFHRSSYLKLNALGNKHEDGCSFKTTGQFEVFKVCIHISIF